MKKKIGISYTRTNFKYYWDWFSSPDLGNDLEKVELSFLAGNYADINACDGFVLTGGVDIAPELYGGPLHFENRPGEFEPGRDRFEAMIYRYAQQHRLPVLGICRGMQLVNVLEGGRLIQDLEQQRNRKHRKEDNIDKIHDVKTENGSLLLEVTSRKDGLVNSAHHQAIDPEHIGKNLLVNAREEDDHNIIEGLEFKDKSGKGFLLCVQWHPERMKDRDENPFSYQLKNRFLDEVRKTAMKKRKIVNPALAKVIKEINEDDAASVDQKLNLLKRGQQKWWALPLESRVDVIRSFSRLLEEQMEPLAATLTAEVGKPLQQSRNEITGGRNRIHWLTENADRYLSDEIMYSEPGLEERIRYEPLGVIGNISAWNYPYLVGINVFIPALLAGNAVLYKPSEHALLVGIDIEVMLKRAGLPDDVFQLVIGGPELGSRLLELPLDGYFFTGSYATGKAIYEHLAARMVPVQCEMGGKDPLYVTEDLENIAAVAAATADGAFYNNGQSCCSVERIYVHERVYDEYVKAFLNEIRSWKLGDPLEQGVYFGPVSRKEQLTVLEDQVADALTKGAELATGGHRMKRPGYYFEPTVLLQVDHTMKIMRDESFGPVIGIMKVSDDEEAIRLMADTEYGLTASVYSSSRARAESILDRLNTGTGYWNCCDRVTAALPWSGRKHSGFGATLSHAGLRAFTMPKAFQMRG